MSIQVRLAVSVILIFQVCYSFADEQVNKQKPKELPEDYITLATSLRKSFLDDYKKFDQKFSENDLITLTHSTIIDLQKIKSTDPSIVYLNKETLGAMKDIITRIENIRKLPKRAGDLQLFTESFINGFLLNPWGVYSLYKDAESKDNAFNNEIRGYFVAYDKLIALHRLLPKTVMPYVTQEIDKNPSFKVDIDATWNGWGNYDWITITNQGEDLADCTIIVELFGIDKTSNVNVHFAKSWKKSTSKYGRYQLGFNFEDKLICSDTVADIQNAKISIMSPKYSTSFEYQYAGKEKQKDIDNRISTIKDKITCGIRNSVLSAKFGKVAKIYNESSVNLYDIHVKAFDTNGNSIGNRTVNQLPAGSYIEIGKVQISRNLTLGDYIKVYVGNQELHTFAID